MIIELLLALVLIAAFTLFLVKILKEGKNDKEKDDKLVFKVNNNGGNFKIIK